MRGIGVGLACVFLCGGASAQVSALDADAAAFGARASVSDVSLSPSGQQVAFIAPAAKGASVASVADLASGKVRLVLRSGGQGERLDWCRFVTDERLVCRMSLIRPMEGMLIPFSRLVAINSDGSNPRRLGQTASDRDEYLRQFDGHVIDWLPGGGGSVLMAQTFIPEVGTAGTRISRDGDGMGVVRVDTAAGKSQTVEQPRKATSNFLSDGRGNIRVMEVSEVSNNLLTGRVRYFYRLANARDWRPLNDYGAPSDFIPLAVDGGIDSLYGLKRLDGRLALYRIRLDESRSSELVASHPKVDIDEVVRSRSGDRVVGYRFAHERRETRFFDPVYKTLHERLAKALPKLPLIEIVEASADGSKVLLHAGADNDPGRYFIFDQGAKRLNEILTARDALADRALSTVQPVSIPLPDGKVMPAYLTLPPGKATASNLPSVVLPHGGPSARDEWGFDWLAQYLASRGFAVIQPNFRGSSGFGDEWLAENGFQSWQVSIGDIAEAARWMASKGIADPKRMAIVGWSYGGYAALQAAATRPDLFQAVAAIAPVTDLQLLKQGAKGFDNARLVARFIGEGPHLREGSPLQRAAEIKVPVLLAHGDLDLNVAVEHSTRMEGALRGRGGDVKLLRFPGLDHQLEDSEARAKLLREIGELLERRLGR